MEYKVVIRNSFATFDIVNQLMGQGSIISYPPDPWLANRSFIAGNFDPHLSAGLLARLGHTVHSKPVHETRDFALYQLSSKGSFTKDYYQMPDHRTLIYDRQLHFAFWEQPPPAEPAYEQADILDTPLGHTPINSPFAKIRGGKPHPGTDYLAAGGTPYHATAKGKVVKASFSTSYGNVVILDHGPGYGGSARVYTLYAHASKLLVHVGGPEVQTGDVVSLSGNTGRVRPKAPGGYHGHYEVIQTNAPFGSVEFYLFKYKHKPTDLRILLRGK